MIEPDEVWELPHQYVGRRVLVFRNVGSTNDLAAELAHDPENAGSVVLAEGQSAGRGQYGRVWQAKPKSSVLLSVLIMPPAHLRRPALLTAWAAVSVCETILVAIGKQARIKWPNDVLLHGRKVCGVLIEQGKGIVAGIGLNINQTAKDFEEAGLPIAGSLASISQQSFDSYDIAKMLLDRLNAEYELLAQGDVATLQACWKWRLGMLGRDVVAETFDGMIYRGRLKECSFDGLQLEQADGRVFQLVPEKIKAIASSHDRGQS
jgi:BirA family biotin operon repressor/biotin-[acetyl-CoA-carboxylase] ligase